MKHVNYSSSHSKGELKPGLGHFQQNRFIAGNNLWKCLSLAHEDYVYDELFDELAEICRLRNEYVDNFF
jgi:hypothetical protein